MTPRQIHKILSLLHSYWPNAKQLKSKETTTAWAEALKRFPYDDVKEAIVNYAVDNKFFPDIYDITGKLSKKEQSKRHLTDFEKRALRRLMEEN